MCWWETMFRAQKNKKAGSRTRLRKFQLWIRTPLSVRLQHRYASCMKNLFIFCAHPGTLWENEIKCCTLIIWKKVFIAAQCSGCDMSTAHCFCKICSNSSKRFIWKIWDFSEKKACKVGAENNLAAKKIPLIYSHQLELLVVHAWLSHLVVNHWWYKYWI